MKKVVLFHLKYCPYCRSACNWIEQAKKDNPALRGVEIEMIEESRHPEIADRYDYWYVPTFYVDGKKVHEGACTLSKVKEILEMGMR